MVGEVPLDPIGNSIDAWGRITKESLHSTYYFTIIHLVLIFLWRPGIGYYYKQSETFEISQPLCLEGVTVLRAKRRLLARSPMTSWVARETLTEIAPTRRVPTGAILTTVVPAEVERTVNQEDQWMPVGKPLWTESNAFKTSISTPKP